MPRTIITSTIPAGQSLSSAIDLSSGSAIFLHVPAEWTPAVLSFLVSPDNILWGDLVDQSSYEITIQIVPGTVMRSDWIPAASGWLKFRSGSRHRPVSQSAARLFTLTIET
jgi:hypothetical protein